MRIKVENLAKKFQDQTILRNVNLDFNGGHIYGIVGRNGSGKSVFMKLLCGFYKPTEGTILYDSVDINSNNVFPPSTRALIEKPTFLPELSGFENLKLLASIQNKIDDEKIIETMRKLNLYDERNKKYSKYSLGTKQKLGIAQVLMENPEVMIFDEPMNGIENETVKIIRDILITEKGKGKLIIVASHIKEDIDNLADEVFEVDNGYINKRK